MNVKNSNSTKKRPLPQYFIAAILVIAVLLVIIPLTTVYMLTRAYDEQIRIETKQISFSIQQTVQSFVGGAYNLSQELAANPSVLTMDAEILTPILADCVARNDYMLLLYITGTDGMQIARSSGQPGDRSGRFWYIQMMETEKPFVSPSYYSLTTSMPCTSVFFPMYEKNSDEMIGILGADIDLASLQRLTEQFASPDSGRFSFIIDGEGVVIAHPDNDFLETLTNYKTLIKTVSVTDDFGNAVLNPDTSVVTRDEEFFVSDGFKQVIESVMNGSGGLEIVEYDGADFFMSYESISLPGFSDSWSVITLQNRTVAMSAASQLFAQVIIIVVCVLAIFVLLIAGFIKTLRTTIKNLEQAQSTTRTVLDTNPQAIVLFDSDFKVVNCNPSAINLLRFNSKKELRENFFERIEKYLPKVQPEGRISIPVTERLKLAATDGYNRVETELHLGNGSKNLLVEMVRIPYANSFAVILYAYDMTDLRIREKELLKAHESNELHLTKLDAVVKSTKIGLYDVSINENNFLHEQNTVVFTDEFRNMLGYSNENDFPSTLENWKKHLHPEDEKQAVEAVVRHISDKSGQTPYDEEYRLLKKNGEYAYFRACGEAIRDKNGNVIRIAGALMDITAAKNRLRDSEQQRIAAEAANERFRIMLDTTPLICNLWNKDGKVFDCNEAALKLFDMNKKDYMEKFLQLAPEIQPDGKFTADIARDMLEKVFSEGSCTFEYIAQKLDGTPIPQHVTLTRVTYEGEHIAVGYGRDLREHKRMMLELEAAQATTFAMFDANPNVNILFSSRFEVIDCNSFALKFLGFETKYEMINGFAERIAKALPKIQPDGRISTSLAERLNAAVQNGTEKFETELFLINRKIIWEVEFRKIPYEDNFAIIAFARDITDTRRRQLELMKANEINELQLTKLNLIIGATQIALWDMYVIKEDPTNPANEIVYSDEFRNMLGYENENDFPNLISSWSDKLHPEDKKNAVDAFAAHMLDKTGKTPFDIEYRLQKKDGEYSFFHAWGETVRDDDGNPVHVAGALMDITEEKNIIINTERLRHQAEEANKAKSVFLANMSHEIRTPLNAVIGLSDLILQSNEWNDENYYRLERINSAGTTLLSTVNDILDISKIESGKFELVPTTYDIPSMINSTVTQSILHRGEKPIEFLMNVCENIPAYLHGDELRMKQILNNFLSNAFKYTLAGTVELSASAERDGENVWLTFTIRDTGIGIKKEDMEKLFSDYVQLDMSANREIVGTGLGLSIAKRLIELMGGEISAESEYGKGSVFVVRLMQKYVSDDVLGTKVVQNLKNLNYSAQKRRQFGEISRISLPYAHVLIVDDVVTNLDVARGLMKPYGMKINCVTSGQAAIEAIMDTRVRYNAVFMDHMMPGMDGIETTRRIRALDCEYAKKIPIIALTANAIIGNEEMFLRNGFQSFLSKPIDINHLDAAIREWVRDKEKEKFFANEIFDEKKNFSSQKIKNFAGRATEFDERSQPIARRPEDSLSFPIKKIDGVNVEKGLARMGGDKDAYIFVLRSYAKNTPPLLDAAQKINPENLTDYATIVHGIRGSSGGINADEIALLAGELENAALAGDFDFAASHNEKFIAAARKLIENISQMLAEIDAENKKPQKNKPDEKILADLRQACTDYEMSGVDAALDALETFEYETDGELVVWLRENAELMNFDEIVERLSPPDA